ncbi:MAG: hypothetical protein K8H88_11455, partial [Sandaracinaceae bacterium]|nr:hypothetical protein [Sandaracinaceae bacterium]
APPEQCRDEECPPGMAGCETQRGGGSMGSTCRVDNDCGEGLICQDDLCVSGSRGSSTPGVDSGMPHFFVQLGGTVGLGFATSGMQADGIPPPGVDPDPWIYGDGIVDPSCYLPGPDLDPEDSFPDYYNYCVRVAQAGLVPTGGIRLNVGYYFLDWFAVAAFARFSPVFGQGDLAFMLFGVRAQFQVTPPTEIGFHAALHLGFSIGQVQLQPPGNGPNAPFVISGLNGIPVGATVGYRFVKHFGLFAQVDLMFQFPTFLFNTDITIGVETGF